MKNVFELMLMLLSADQRKLSINLLRKFQRSSLRGIQILDAKLRNPKSPLAASLWRLYMNGSGDVSLWLDKLSGDMPELAEMAAFLDIEPKSTLDMNLAEPTPALLEAIQRDPNRALAALLSVIFFMVLHDRKKNRNEEVFLDEATRELRFRPDFADRIRTVLTNCPLPEALLARYREAAKLDKGTFALTCGPEPSQAAEAAEEASAVQAPEAAPSTEASESRAASPSGATEAAEKSAAVAAEKVKSKKAGETPQEEAAEDSPSAAAPEAPAANASSASSASSGIIGAAPSANKTLNKSAAVSRPAKTDKNGRKKAVARALSSVLPAVETKAMPEVSAVLRKRMPGAGRKSGAAAEEGTNRGKRGLPDSSKAAPKGAEPERKDLEIVPPIEVPETDRPRLAFDAGDPIPPLSPAAPGMLRALGYVRQLGTYWNFYPVLFEENGRFSPIGLNKAKERYPRYGAFNIYSTKKRQFIGESHYLLEWRDSDLRDNLDAYTQALRPDFQKRLDVEPVIEEGRLSPLSEKNGYVVVYPDLPAGESPDFSTNIFVRLSPKPSAAGSAGAAGAASPAAARSPGDAALFFDKLPAFVLLRAGDMLLGPVRLAEDRFGRRYVNLDIGRQQGVVRGFAAKEARSIVRVAEECRLPNDVWCTVEADILFAQGMRPVLFDLFTDEMLLSKAASSASKLQERAALSALSDAIDRQGAYLSEEPRVREARLERLTRLIRRAAATGEAEAGLADYFAAFLTEDTKGSRALLDCLADAVLKTPERLAALESHRRVVEAVEAAKTKLEGYEAKVRKLEAAHAAQTEKLRAETQTLKRECNAAAKELAQYKDVLGGIVESRDRIELRNRLQAESAEAAARVKRYQQEIEALDAHLRESVNNAKNYAFDGALAAKFMQAAADWSRGSVQDAAARSVLRAETLPILPVQGEALAEYLIKEVQKHRHYDRNTILNLFITTTQNFLTILAGAPGTGKTSAARLLGYVLGLSTVARHFEADAREKAEGSEKARRSARSQSEAMNRFLSVSVERGWTSKRDFLGFFNTLTQRFESPDPRRHEAFRQLSEEAQRGFETIPYLMLLDEANLSPMEFYWADFMDIADQRTASAAITLGDGTRCVVPDTLRFVATINNDFTTENLSPRLIDRAAVVTLPRPSLASLAAAEQEIDYSIEMPLVAWPAMKALFGAKPLSEREKSRVLEKLVAACKPLDEVRSPVSPRTMKAMLAYASAGIRLLSPETGGGSLAAALDFAVSQKLLPKVNGNGEAMRLALEALRGFCEDEGLPRSALLLEDMLRRGEENLGDYGYF